MRLRRLLPIALVMGLAIPLIGCPIVVLKICVNNDTPHSLLELNVSPSSDPSWGPNKLDQPIAPGGSAKVTGIEPGTYDIRAVFDGKTATPCQCCEVYSMGVVFTTLNLCVSYTGYCSYGVTALLDWYL